MSSKHPWRVHISNMDTIIRVGIHPHEQTPQRVRISAVVEGEYPARPTGISDCFDYDHVHKLVVDTWPTQQHTDLLEMLAVELLEYIFQTDSRVQRARVTVCKPDIFAQAESVGVEAEWTRADFERFTQ